LKVADLLDPILKLIYFCLSPYVSNRRGGTEKLNISTSEKICAIQYLAGLYLDIGATPAALMIVREILFVTAPVSLSLIFPEALGLFRVEYSPNLGSLAAHLN